MGLMLNNVHSSIVQTIGNTPMLELGRMREKYQVGANIIAKLEFFNPMSSTKDRPAHAMIEALMKSKLFTKHTHIIEATSGNNGVSCAWLCAIYKIPLTIVIPEHMSIERRKMIKHFGAKVITTPKNLGTKGAIDKAQSLVMSDKHAISLDQFSNKANSDCHANTTAEEIWNDCAGNVDVFVAGVGTGGTISGIGRTLKAKQADICVVAVEPASCPMLSEGKKGVHAIQGLSSGHIPNVLERGVIDKVETVEDDDALFMARELALVEGLAVGISSGATMAAALRLAAEPERKGKNIIVMFADTAERYYSTNLFLD